MKTEAIIETHEIKSGTVEVAHVVDLEALVTATDKDAIPISAFEVRVRYRNEAAMVLTFENSTDATCWAAGFVYGARGSYKPERAKKTTAKKKATKKATESK